MRTSKENYYGKQVAKYYDIVAYYNYDEVVKSFVTSIKGKKILEIGVGTGNVAMRLARLGFRVDGIDNSIFMLDTARRKLQKEKAGIRQKVKLYLQSAANLKLKGPYDAIISQGGVLAWVGPHMESYLKSKNTVRKLLARIFEILNKGGSLILSMQAARPETKSIKLNSGMTYSGIIKRKKDTLVVTHILRKDIRILAKQTFEKLILKKAEFERICRDVGFKILGKNKMALHYVLTK